MFSIRGFIVAWHSQHSAERKSKTTIEIFLSSDTLVTGRYHLLGCAIMAGLEVWMTFPFAMCISRYHSCAGKKNDESSAIHRPLNVIDECADALRFSILFLAPLGLDVRFSTEIVELEETLRIRFGMQEDSC